MALSTNFIIPQTSMDASRKHSLKNMSVCIEPVAGTACFRYGKILTNNIGLRVLRHVSSRSYR